MYWANFPPHLASIYWKTCDFSMKYQLVRPRRPLIREVLSTKCWEVASAQVVGHRTLTKNIINTRLPQLPYKIVTKYHKWGDAPECIASLKIEKLPCRPLSASSIMWNSTLHTAGRPHSVMAKPSALQSEGSGFNPRLPPPTCLLVSVYVKETRAISWE